MFIIGERINGMYKKVGEAIESRDENFIRLLARNQVKAGADALDICVGPSPGDPKDNMSWLINTVSEEVDVPLCIDSPNPDVLEAGVEAAPGKTIINSVKYDPEHMQKLFPLALNNDSEIICLLMTKKGIPSDLAEKLEIAVNLLSAAAEYGIDQQRIYLDPILLPVANAQQDVAVTFELMDQLRILTVPSPHIIVGLSNLSQKARHRSLLNRTYCAIAMSHGLDTVILDPLDKKLMKTILTTRILLNQKLYARSYLKDLD